MSEIEEFENAKREHQRFVPEDMVQLQNSIITPDSKELFYFLNKDLVLSFLKENEVWITRAIIDFITELKLTQPKNLGTVENDGSSFYMAKLYGILNTARSRNGFQQKVFNTSTQRLIKSEDEKKRPWSTWPGSKK